MKRLTQRIKNSDKVITPYCLLEETCDGMGASKKCNDCEHTKMVLEKLASYEDAEEQGLLLRLPCKVGDTVWAIRHYRGVVQAQQGFVSEMYFTKEMKLMIVVKHVARGEYGKTVFITKEEAEAKLKEMEE